MKKTAKRKKKAEPKSRGYAELASVGGGINSDWPVSQLSDDADIWRNCWALTSRVRDLFKTNPVFQSYRETFWANVYGSNGIMLRSTVKENEDRVIHTPEEKNAVKAFEDRRNRVMEFFATKRGEEFKARSIMGISGTNGSRVATVKVGEPDIYARQLIERRWADWQQAKFCDVRGTRNYHTIRLLRGISAVRDGDFFIRMVRNPAVNKYGFALQLINAEWCDHFLNCTLQNGNVVRMGIEYQMSAWGLGKVVAFYFIKRQPTDWQYGGRPSMDFVSPTTHERIDARDIVHCARPVDAEGTRPAPWVASTIPKARQLDQYELAEVVAARAQACKIGYLYSDVNPEGGSNGVDVDPRTGLPTSQLSPGDMFALPWGVKYGQTDPTHPNGNAENFRKMMLRSQCAGMPGSSYPTMAHDYEAVSFSAGRLARLDSNELFKMIQRWDIDSAENPIFEAWLEMALATGALPLPITKYEKFNSKTFSGRRWEGIDATKEAVASATAIANRLSSRTRECAERGLDFEELIWEQAEEEILMAQFGIKSETTVENPTQPPTESAEENDEADEKETKKTVKKKSVPARK